MSPSFSSFGHLLGKDSISGDFEIEEADPSDEHSTHHQVNDLYGKFAHQPKSSKPKARRTAGSTADSPIDLGETTILEDSDDEVQAGLAPQASTSRATFAAGVLEKMSGTSSGKFYGDPSRSSNASREPIIIKPGASVMNDEQNRPKKRNSATQGSFQPGTTGGYRPKLNYGTGKKKEEQPAFAKTKEKAKSLQGLNRIQKGPASEDPGYNHFKASHNAHSASTSGMGPNGLDLPHRGPSNQYLGDINLNNDDPRSFHLARRESDPSVEELAKKKGLSARKKGTAPRKALDDPPKVKVVHELVDSDEDGSNHTGREQDPLQADPIQDADGITLSDEDVNQASKSASRRRASHDPSTDDPIGLQSIQRGNTSAKRENYEPTAKSSRIAGMKPKNAPSKPQLPPPVRPAKPGVTTPQPSAIYSLPVKRAYLGLQVAEDARELVIHPSHLCLSFEGRTASLRVDTREIQAVKVPVALSQDHNHLPLFFSMSVRKIKTPTKFERSGIFEPGADYRGNESWIFIQFSDNKDFESKNLAALVEMFRKGSEGTIPKESLITSDWNGVLGVTELLCTEQLAKQKRSSRSVDTQSHKDSIAADPPTKRPNAIPTTSKTDGTNKTLPFTSKTQPSTASTRRNTRQSTGHTLDGRTVVEQIDVPSSRKRKAEEEIAAAPQDEFSGMPSDKVILVYPFEGTGGISVTVADARRLDGDDFLNDTLIEFGLRRIQDELKFKDPQAAAAVHMFNSFFYKRFTQKPKTKDRKQPVDNYLPVSKWTAKFDFFKKDYIVVPINENLHWYLAIICNPGRILELPEGDTERRQSGRLADKPVPTPAAQVTSKQDLSVAMDVDPPAPLDDQHKSVEDAAIESRTVSESSPAPAMSSRQQSASPSDQASRAVSPTGSQGSGMSQARSDQPLQTGAQRASRDSSAQIDETADEEDLMDIEEPPDEESEKLFEHQQQAFFAKFAPTVNAPVETAADTIMTGIDENLSTSAETNQPVTTLPPVDSSDEELEYAGPPEKVPSAEVLTSTVDVPQVLATDAAPQSADPSEMTPGSRQCHILTFDSLGGSHAAVINKLRYYMSREAGHKKSIDIKPKTLEANVVGSLCGCPQQEGFSDCGVFLLHFVQKFLEDPALAIAHVSHRPKAISKGKHIIESWKSGSIPARRGMMRKDIAELSKQWLVIKEKRDAEEEKARAARRAEKAERLRAEAAAEDAGFPTVDVPVASTSALTEVEAEAVAAPLVSNAQPPALTTRNQAKRRKTAPAPTNQYEIMEISDEESQSPQRPSPPKAVATTQSLSNSISPTSFGTGKDLKKKDKHRAEPVTSNPLHLSNSDHTTSGYFPSKASVSTSVKQSAGTSSTRDSGVHLASKSSGAASGSSKKSKKRVIPQDQEEDEDLQLLEHPSASSPGRKSRSSPKLPGSHPDQQVISDEEEVAPPSAQPLRVSSPFVPKPSSPPHEPSVTTSPGASGFNTHTRYNHDSLTKLSLPNVTNAQDDLTML